jgi:hypothetical protein
MKTDKRGFRSSPIRFSPIIGEIPEVILAKVHLTFAKLIILRQSEVELIIPNVSQKLRYWRKFSEYIGESILDVRQSAKVQGIYWRKSSLRNSYRRTSGNPDKHCLIIRSVCSMWMYFLHSLTNFSCLWTKETFEQHAPAGRMTVLI